MNKERRLSIKKMNTLKRKRNTLKRKKNTLKRKRNKNTLRKIGGWEWEIFRHTCDNKTYEDVSNGKNAFVSRVKRGIETAKYGTLPTYYEITFPSVIVDKLNEAIDIYDISGKESLKINPESGTFISNRRFNDCRKLKTLIKDLIKMRKKLKKKYLKEHKIKWRRETCVNEMGPGVGRPGSHAFAVECIRGKMDFAYLEPRLTTWINPTGLKRRMKSCEHRVQEINELLEWFSYTTFNEEIDINKSFRQKFLQIMKWIKEGNKIDKSWWEKIK